ncbi:hypothetical protein MUK42_34100 [Musa troglodytarum]|uniref:Uncharacterized protein n=1 Tax=Musa troglodytarum TaxID=320322 RepID=A0A9E7JUX9_9LILI|nr:hypothetical protein MUK42_34100 [Musa troglodytarum]
MKPLIMMTSSQKKRNQNGYHHFTRKDGAKSRKYTIQNRDQSNIIAKPWYLLPFRIGTVTEVLSIPAQ